MKTENINTKTTDISECKYLIVKHISKFLKLNKLNHILSYPALLQISLQNSLIK